MENKDAIKRIKDFGLYHAIGDLPNSALTVEAFNKAIRLLELEESGKLIILPCKIGDTVYILKNKEFIPHFGVEKGGIVGATLYRIIHTSKNDKRYYFYYTFGGEKIYIDGDDSIFNKTIFLTREEAENKLKEMDNEKI